MTRFLLYLPALACPLLMLVCMAGMRRMHNPPAQARTARPPAGTDQRIARLEQELAALHAEGQHAGDPAQATQTAPTDPHAERPPAPADRVS
jgi:predicted secreted protein